MAKRKVQITVEDRQPVATNGASEPKLCGCGCGQTVLGKKAKYAVGHDQWHRGNLLRAFDGGDQSAAAESTAHFGYTAEELALRGAKGADEEAKRAAQAKAKAERRTTKLQERIAKIDAQIASLTEQRTRLLTAAAAVAGE